VTISSQAISSSTANPRLTLRSSRNPPAWPSVLSQHLANSAPLVASVKAGPVSFLRSGGFEMSTHSELANAFHEGRRHPEEMPFVLNDAVELQDGPDAGLRGSVISAFREESGWSYRVELSTGRDVQASPNELRLLDS